jgi:hypothetical protein
MIALTSGRPYEAVGGEMVPGDGQPKNAVPTPSRIFLNGLELNLAAYNIGGNNFFKLRDLMGALDIGVTYDEVTRNIGIDTSQGYPPENAESAVLIISPAAASEPADDMEDADLISMFEATIYKNATDALFGWLLDSGGLDLDENSILNPEAADWVRPPGIIGPPPPFIYEIKNMNSAAQARANLEAVFSFRYLEKTIYPLFIDQFVEQDGKFWYHPLIGGGTAYYADFTRAKVIDKSADAFKIETPMVTPSDQTGELFTYRVGRQNGYWVLDNYYAYGSD